MAENEKPPIPLISVVPSGPISVVAAPVIPDLYVDFIVQVAHANGTYRLGLAVDRPVYGQDAPVRTVVFTMVTTKAGIDSMREAVSIADRIEAASSRIT